MHQCCYMNEDDWHRWRYITPAISSLSVEALWLRTFRCRNYVSKDNLYCWYYLSYCHGSAIPLLHMFGFFLPAFRDWCNTKVTCRLCWFFLSFAIAILTTIGFFLSAFCRCHYMIAEDLKPVISMLVEIGSILPALGWYYLNDNWHQQSYYLRTTIAVLCVIASFLPAFLDWWILSDYNLQRCWCLRSAIAVLFTIWFFSSILLEMLELGYTIDGD